MFPYVAKTPIGFAMILLMSTSLFSGCGNNSPIEPDFDASPVGRMEGAICGTASLNFNQPNPSVVGTNVVITGSGSNCGSGTLEYKFLIKKSTDPNYVTLRDWSTQGVWTWYTDADDGGDYYFLLFVREQGDDAITWVSSRFSLFGNSADVCRQNVSLNIARPRNAGANFGFCSKA